MSTSSIKLLAGLILFCSALGLIGWVIHISPSLPDKQKLRIPIDIQSTKALGEVICQYKDQFRFNVIIIFSLVFLFLQSFAIPGTVFFTFLAGTLFDLIPGMLFVALLSAVGASGAYFMSNLFGRQIIQKLAPNKLRYFNEQVAKHRSNMWCYFIFVRVSPILPNWFVNLASPLLSVPFHIFFIGTFIGVLPQSFIAMKAGLMIQEVNSLSDIIDYRTIASLVLIGSIALLPTLQPVRNFFSTPNHSTNANFEKNK